MADLRTKAVTPAAVSYTPLDLSKVRGQLGKKVQEVEGAATTGKNLISSLDFKDGYMLAGLAKETKAEYTDRVQKMVDGLYSSGDTRTFSSELSALTNQIGSDERILAGQKDFEMSKVHDAYGMDPAKRSLYYGYTNDNSPTGKITQLDWKNKDINAEDVQNAYKIYGKVDFYDDYSPMFKDLSSTTFEEYMGVTPEGFSMFKTTKGPSELSQEIGDFTQEELAAQALKIENPNLYRRLQSDYENSATSSANTYKEGMGKTLEEFVGGVVLENLPFLEDTVYNLTDPPKGIITDDTESSSIVKVKTQAFATMVERGAGSEINARTGLSNEEIAGSFNSSNADSVTLSAILADPEATPEELEVVSFAAAITNDWNENGDANRQDVYGNGNELIASANEATSEILTANNFIETYMPVMGNQNPVEFFHKLRNTRNLLGQIHSNGFDLEDKENLISDYDGETHPEYSQHITNGVGFLTPEELEGVLNTLESETIDEREVGGRTGSVFGRQSTSTQDTESGPRGVSSTLGSAIAAYNKASDFYTLPNGNTRSINREMPFETDIEPYLKEIKGSSPIAFYEMAHNDMMRRSSLYHTDVIIKPGEILSKEIMEPALKFTAQEFTGINGADLPNQWQLKRIIGSEEGGLSGLSSTGLNSSRVENISGTGVIKSPYQEEKWNSKEGKKFLEDFRSFGAGTNEDDLNFNFHGVLMPGGHANDMGLVISRTIGKKTDQFFIQPMTNTSMENNALYKQIKKARKSLTGKDYLPVVLTGDAYINQSGRKIYKTIQEDNDLNNVRVDYAYTDTKNQLTGTKFFNPAENIVVQGEDGTTAEVSNMYFDGTTSVVADIQGGKEVYRLRSKDGTGDRTWGEYLNNFQEEVKDPSNTYLGVQDYKDFVVSILLNQEYINDNGGNVGTDKLMGLLNQPQLQSVQKITEELGTDWEILTNTPITFFGKKEALYHFAGQPGDRGRPDSFGNPQSGYVVK
tara:strand:- start:3846 stop:6782 length:2937 start_codon:yes stop_codon:yes gene_type:complete